MTRSPPSRCTTASRSRSSASASSRCRPRTPRRSVEEALAAGYRHIDTAAAYRNEARRRRRDRRLRAAREEVFVTTKLWNSEQGYDSTLRRLREEPRAARARPRRPLPDPLADAGRGPLPRHLARLRTDPATRAAPARSASPTSASRTSSGWPARPSCCRPSTRSSCTRCLQQAELRAWHAEHGDRHRGLEPARPGRACSTTTTIDDDRRPPRAHAGPGDPALAPAARQRRDPEVGDPGADPRELRGLRLRAERGRHGGDRPPRPGERTGPDPATFVAP